MPPGSALTVIDRTGTILARYPEPEKWVGQTLSDADLVRAILTKVEGTAQVAGVDGVERLYAFSPLDGGRDFGVHVSLGIPTALAFAETYRRLTRNLAWLALVTAMAIAAAWIGGDAFILQRVNALVGATRRLAAGDLRARSGLASGRGELSELAQTFDEMAEALERRQVEAERAAEELRGVNRALEELRSCNQAMLWATGESELLHEVCGIIVAQGGYRLCWVAYA